MGRLQKAYEEFGTDLYTIEDIYEEDSISFKVRIGEFAEQVNINNTNMNMDANIFLYPITKIDYGNDSAIRIGTIDSHVLLHPKTGRVIFRNRKPIILGKYIRKFINESIDIDINSYALEKDDIDKILSFGNITSINKMKEDRIVVMSVYDIIIDIINNRVPGIILSDKKSYSGISIESAIRDTLSEYLQYNINRNDNIESDLKTKVILPKYLEGKMMFLESISRNDSPQSEKSGITVHLADGIEVIDHKLVRVYDSIPGCSSNQVDNPFIRFMSANRTQVRRACYTQWMNLLDKDVPLVYSSKKKYNIDTRNLVTVLGYWNNEEDGCIISKSAASKLSSYIIDEKYITVDKDSELNISEYMSSDKIVSLVKRNGINKILDDIAAGDKQKRRTNKYLPDKSTIIGKYLGNPMKSPISGIVCSIVKTHTIKERINNVDGLRTYEFDKYQVKTIRFYYLNPGDKLSGYYHGNKMTVTAILPDDEMPIIQHGRKKIRVELVITPEIAKRGIPSLLMECYYSRLGNKQELDPNKITFNEPKKSKLTFESYLPTIAQLTNYNVFGKLQVSKDVMWGNIRIVRLNHSSQDKVKSAYDSELDENLGHKSGSIILPGVTYTLLSHNCASIVDELLLDVDSKMVNEFNQIINCLKQEEV